jgi:hypothetical protein
MTPDTPRVVLMARQNPALHVADPLFPALRIVSSISGASTLQSRLRDRLRQKHGSGYSVGCSPPAAAADHA